MYTKFYGLTDNPFRLTPDPRFLYFTPNHRECLATLFFGIQARKGFLVVTGDAGTGKTTLIHSLLTSLKQKKLASAYVFHPLLEPVDFLDYVLRDLNLTPSSRHKGEMIHMLQGFLLKRHEEGSTTVLIVDEAHRLSPELLEEIRLLTNLETSTHKLLQVVLAGQSEMDELFRREDLRQLKQRISLRSRLVPLTAEQTSEYVAHRLIRCGRHGNDLFPTDVLRLVQRFSRGIPRLVNSICDNALLLAFANGAPAVTAKMVLEVANDLDLREKETPPVAVAKTNGASQAPPVIPDRSFSTLEQYSAPKRTFRFLPDWAQWRSRAR